MKIVDLLTGEIRDNSGDIPAGWAEFIQPKTCPELKSTTIVDRLELVQMLAATGKGEALGKALSELPTADREEWYARQVVDLADPRIQQVMKALEIDIPKIKK